MKKNILIVVLLGAVIFFTLNLFNNWIVPNKEELVLKEALKYAKEKDRVDVNNPAKIWLDKDSVTHATKEVKPTYTIDAALSDSMKEEFYKRVNNNLKIAAKQVQEFTKVKAVLSGEIPKASIQIGTDKSVTIEYKNKYLTVVTRKDSIGNILPAQYTYNAELNKVRYGEKTVTFFGKEPIVYDDWSSPDPNFRVGEVDQFIQKVDPQKNLLKLTADLGLLVPLKTQGAYPPLGQALLNLNLNPDGFISPKISYGTLIPLGKTDVMSTKPIQYIGAGATINLINIKKSNKNNAQKILDRVKK